MAAANGDERIMRLAADISKSLDRDIPMQLLKLSEILKKTRAGSRESALIKLDVWQFDLLSVLMVSLKTNFERVKNSWSTATTLAQLLLDVVTSLAPPDDLDRRFELIALPAALEALLVLCRHIQERYIDSQKKQSSVTEMDSVGLLEQFHQVLEILGHLLSSIPNLVPVFIRSNWFLQLFVTDDEATALRMLEQLQLCLRLQPDAVKNMDPHLLHIILDEMVYDLSVSDSSRLAGATLRTLLNICQTCPSVVDKLCLRYRGLRLLVSKWTGRGAFGRELAQLIFLLDSGSAQRVKVANSVRAVLVIQAAWRSWRERKRLRRADKAMARFQSQWRRRVQRRKANSEAARERREMEHQVALRRQRLFRNRLEQQMAELELLPGSQVQAVQQRRRQQSAVRIQAQWRGFHERRQLTQRKTAVQQLRSAIVIQRAVRRWLQRLATKRAQPPAFQRPPGLTDERRQELSAQIRAWQDSQAKRAQPLSRTEQVDLHARAQSELFRFQIRSRETRLLEQQRQITLVRLAQDSELLLDAPKLQDLMKSNLEVSDHYVSRSVPVAIRALQLHKVRMQQMNQSWWRQLIDVERDADDAENNEYQLTRGDMMIIDGKIY